MNMHISQFYMNRVLVVAALLWAGQAWPQTPSTVEEVLKFGAEKTASYADWSGDFVQTARMGTGEFQQKGHLAMKRPRQVWMQMTIEIVGQPSTNLVVAGADGIAWTEISAMGQKQVMKMDLNKTIAGMGQNPSQNADPAEQVKRYQELFDFQLKDSRAQNEQAMFVLEGAKKSATTN